MSTSRSDRSGSARAADQLPRAVFQHAGLHDQGSSSTNGSHLERINPDWVETLMGVPVMWTQISIEWIGCDSSATE
jgi:hypothetical protein